MLQAAAHPQGDLDGEATGCQALSGRDQEGQSLVIHRAVEAARVFAADLRGQSRAGGVVTPHFLRKEHGRGLKHGGHARYAAGGSNIAPHNGNLGGQSLRWSRH